MELEVEQPKLTKKDLNCHALALMQNDFFH